MPIAQYATYCIVFDLRSSLRKVFSGSVHVIGGKGASIGTEIILIPFKHLQLAIDVNVLVITEYIASLLSMEYMIENILYISIQGR